MQEVNDPVSIVGVFVVVGTRLKVLVDTGLQRVEALEYQLALIFGAAALELHRYEALLLNGVYVLVPCLLVFLP